MEGDWKQEPRPGTPEYAAPHILPTKIFTFLSAPNRVFLEGRLPDESFINLMKENASFSPTHSLHKEEMSLILEFSLSLSLSLSLSRVCVRVCARVRVRVRVRVNEKSVIFTS